MGRQFFRFVLFLCAAFILACGSSGKVALQATPVPVPGPRAESLAPPGEKFSVPVSEISWIPAAPGSGLAGDFVRALRDQKSVALLLPAEMSDGLMEDRIYQMIRSAAPETKVVARAKGVLDKLLEERGEIPYRVTLQPGGAYVLVRPYNLPKEHPLNTDWLAKKTALKGAKALLTIRPIRGDDQKLRELRRRQQGGCDEMLASLQDALDQAPEYFESVVDVSLATLSESFARHLDLALPFWMDELAETERSQMPGSLGNRCVEAYRVFLKGYEPCLEGPCQIGPRIYATGRGFVGMVDTSQLIPEGCSRAGLRDYRAEIVDLGGRAAEEMLAALNDGWPCEFLRYGGLERLQNNLEQFCTPRHRRLREGDLEGVRQEVQRFLSRLKVADLQGEWQKRQGLERAPRVGPIHVLARVQVAGFDPVAEADQLEKKMRRLEHCIGGGERLLQAALIDVGTSEVHFMGIFFEEELLCDGFAPGFP